MITKDGTRWQLWLDEPTGNRVRALEPESIDVTMVANDVGAVQIRMGEKFNHRELREDMLIEVWRGNGTDTLKWVTTGMVRAWGLGNADNGKGFTLIMGPDQNDFFARRYVAAKATTAGALKTDYCDDMMRDIVRESLGASAGAGRDLSAYITVGADVGLAPSITKEMSYLRVLRVLQDIAEESKNKGMLLYFNLKPTHVSQTKIGFTFNTYINYLGMDRSLDSANPTYFGMEWGNIANPYLVYDSREEENYIYVGGKGQDTDRVVAEIQNANRVAKSIYNRREGFVASPGSELAELDGIGRTRITELQPTWTLTCDLLNTPRTLYGRMWQFGDRVTVKYRGRQFTGNIRAVRLTGTADGVSTVEAKFEGVTDSTFTGILT